VIGDCVVAPRSREPRAGDLIAAAHGHADDILAPATGEHLAVGLRDHPGIAHEQTPRELPALEIALHLRDAAHIHRIAGEHESGATSEALAGNREPPDDSRAHRRARSWLVTSLARCRVVLGPRRLGSLHKSVRLHCAVLIIDRVSSRLVVS
jgi:hypothetical protein